MKHTKTYLKKLEDLCGALSYKVRYEQGHFQSGYCILESRKVLIINKFFDLEGRINCLQELIPEIPADFDELPEEYKSLYNKMISLRASQESES